MRQGADVLFTTISPVPKTVSSTQLALSTSFFQWMHIFRTRSNIPKESGNLYLVRSLVLYHFKNISTLRLSFFIREVKDHLNYEHRVFNSEEFLKTRALGDQQFYKQVRALWGVHACVYSILCTLLCFKYFSHPGFPASVSTFFCVLAFLEVWTWVLLILCPALIFLIKAF